MLLFEQGRRAERPFFLRPSTERVLPVHEAHLYVDGSKEERTTMMRRAIFVVVLGMSTLVLVVGVALATPPKGATTTVLTRATFGTFAEQNSGVKVKSKQGEADLVMAKQVIEPGGVSGWHHHPAVSFFLVKSGSVTAYDKNCKKTVYKAGEGFIESSAHPGLVRNQGKVDAVVYATHIIPTKTTEEGFRIDDPQPKNCNVK
jgi:quercetin dioxygenase-like cupin family protein